MHRTGEQCHIRANHEPHDWDWGKAEFACKGETRRTKCTHKSYPNSIGARRQARAVGGHAGRCSACTKWMVVV